MLHPAARTSRSHLLHCSTSKEELMQKDIEPRNDGEFGGDYARDTHETLGDDYARDGGWSGAGRHDDFIREESRKPDAVDDHPHHDDVTIGKASE
jgi:hypothetical protein